MIFEPQNPLEESLVRASSDPAHHPQFYRDLLDSDIFFIRDGPVPEAPEGVTLEEGESVAIVEIEWNGKRYLPIFSSLLRLQNVIQREVGYMGMNARTFLELTQGADVVLNPGSSYGKELTKAEIAALLDGSIWQPENRVTFERDTQVLLGQPARYPQQLVDALRRLFATLPQVERASLAHIFIPGPDQVPHTIVGILAADDWDQVVAEAGVVARGCEIPDPPVDFVQLTPQATGVGNYLLQEAPAFYERE